MSGFQESSAKQAVRQLLLDAATRLQRQDLTYLGMPAESAREYKRVMNTLILVFSKDVDPHCNIRLGSPDGLLDEPCCVYDPDQLVPRLVPLLDV